jgi:hypothetical protein
VRPALLTVNGKLIAAAVDNADILFTVDINPDLGSAGITAAHAVDPGVTIGRNGPVALVVAGANIVALAVDAVGTLRAATRPVAGGFFTNLFPVDTHTVLAPCGGVSAVSVPNGGVMAVVTGPDGVLWFAVSPDGVVWPRLEQVDWRQYLPVL